MTVIWRWIQETVESGVGRRRGTEGRREKDTGLNHIVLHLF
jgi:hypothetical protein